MFDELIATHGGRLFGFCMKLCRSREEADDLYQETWLKAYRFYDKYNKSRPFEPWLTSICVNCYKDRLRRNRFSRLLQIFGTSEEYDKAMEALPHDDRSLEYYEVRDAASRLPENLRLVIALHYFYDMNVKEIARALRIPEGTVKYRLVRARELLGKELEDG